MITIDRAMLAEVGLGDLPPEAAGQVLRHVYRTLELRVGTRLMQRMTEEQLDEFEGFLETSDDEGASAWMETNLPDHRDVAREEFARLKGELAARSAQLLAAARG